METAEIYSKHDTFLFRGSSDDCIHIAMNLAERFGRTVYIRYSDRSQLRVSAEPATGQPVTSAVKEPEATKC